MYIEYYISCKVRKVYKLQLTVTVTYIQMYTGAVAVLGEGPGEPGLTLFLDQK